MLTKTTLRFEYKLSYSDRDTYGFEIIFNVIYTVLVLDATKTNDVFKLSTHYSHLCPLSLYAVRAFISHVGFIYFFFPSYLSQWLRSNYKKNFSSLLFEAITLYEVRHAKPHTTTL